MGLNSACPPPGREDEHRRYSLLPGEIERAAERIDPSRYLGGQMDPRDEDGLIFYWCGDLPAEITEIIARSGVAAQVRPVPYRADLLRRYSWQLCGHPSIASAGVGRDLRSLTIHVLPGTPPVEVAWLCRPIPAPPDPSVAARFPDVHAIPVTFGGHREPGVLLPWAVRRSAPIVTA